MVNMIHKLFRWIFVWVIKMLQYDRIVVPEGFDINKSNKSKKCSISHCWYFKDIGYKFQPYVCNGCHDILMMTYELKNIAILNVIGIDYRCVLRNMSKNDAINRLNNSKLDDKGTLWIWFLVEIKHLLR